MRAQFTALNADFPEENCAENEALREGLDEIFHLIGFSVSIPYAVDTLLRTCHYLWILRTVDPLECWVRFRTFRYFLDCENFVFIYMSSVTRRVKVHNILLENNLVFFFSE